MFNFTAATKRLTDLTNYTRAASADTPADAPLIEFVCKDEYYGAIPEPVPANTVLPEWYTALSGKRGAGLKQSTVKRCAPFLDAMTAGWIIPLVADIEIEATPTDWRAEWNFTEKLLGSHDEEQLGRALPEGQNIIKFINYWAIRVPEGYSVLFVAPLNRHEPRFQPFSGMVDCDRYFNFVNLPAIWTAGTYHDVLPAGTPLIQVIPIQREAMLSDGVARAMTEDETRELHRTQARLKSREGAYRDELWEPKRGSRMVADQ